MELWEYQKAALRTANPDLMKDWERAMSYAVLKLAGEAGEVADTVGKWLGQGHDLDREELLLEMGDVLWHLSYLAEVLGIGLEYVARANLKKLAKRYPDGFDSKRSRVREGGRICPNCKDEMAYIASDEPAWYCSICGDKFPVEPLDVGIIEVEVEQTWLTECPECGAMGVVQESGCETCQKCGWSACKIS